MKKQRWRLQPTNRKITIVPKYNISPPLWLWLISSLKEISIYYGIDELVGGKRSVTKKNLQVSGCPANYGSDSYIF
jgi:hypothetical protein